MGRRKRKWVAKGFESLGERFQDPNTGAVRADTSANIYQSMLLHPAFTTLKPRQQMLYVQCKSQFYGARKPRQDFPDIEMFQDDACFYMNRELATRYGDYTKNMKRELYADLKTLEEHGLIKCISSGRSTKSKSVYKFVSDWRDWKPS